MVAHAIVVCVTLAREMPRARKAINFTSKLATKDTDKFSGVDGQDERENDQDEIEFHVGGDEMRVRVCKW